MLLLLVRMTSFHSLFPELAQREVRCLHLGLAAADAEPHSKLPPDEYVFMELYCEDLSCDCRRVFFQVIRKGDRQRVLANIVYGWEKESFYRKRTRWGDGDFEARQVVRGELDPLNEQSEFAEELLELFKRFVLDEPYRLRLRRHYRLFKEELARRNPPDARIEDLR